MGALTIKRSTARLAHNFICSQLRQILASRSSKSGFTLLELLCVVVLVGVLMAIAAPNWGSFANNRKLTVAQEQVHQAISKARQEAAVRRVQQEVNFRQSNDDVQWSVHSASTAPSNWQNLQAGVQIDTANTTLYQANSVYRLQFNEQGNVTGQIGKLTLSVPNGGSSKRCVFASTLIGMLRKAQDTACE